MKLKLHSPAALLCLAVSWSAAVSAQNADDSAGSVGVRPPVMSLRDVMTDAMRQHEANSAANEATEAPSAPEHAVEEAPAVQEASAADDGPDPADAPPEADPPPAQRPTASTSSIANARAQATAAAQPPRIRPSHRDSVKPAPSRMTVESGTNHVIGIAFSHLNRIITPFANPVVKTTSLATTTAEGSIVYVATNLPEPVGLFIHDADQPEVAISLTLVPSEIPPVSTQVSVKGYEPEDVPKIRHEPTLATAFEQEHTYLDMLKVLLKDLALGRVPDGYGFKRIAGHFPGMPTCVMPGIHVIPLQLITGTSLQVVVGKAQNTSTAMTSVREDACAGPGLRAVAAWPSPRLAPGEAAEIYFVLDAAQHIAPERQRPSILGGVR